DIHAGVCGHHAAPRTLVGNAFRQGFYWPTAVADATDVVRTCEGCQFYARKTHLLVAVDKFSKWIEARPIGKIKSEQAILFFTDIIFRFGVPNSIITDNG